MGFRPLIDPNEERRQPSGGGRFRPLIDPNRKRTWKDDAIGVASTINANIPFMDEVADTLQAGAELATGRAKGFGEAWRTARDLSSAQRRDLVAERPKVAALSRGVGMAAQAVPLVRAAAAPGVAVTAGRQVGTAVAPLSAQPAAARGVAEAIKRYGARAAPAIGAGGLTGVATGLGSEGTLRERGIAGYREGAFGAGVGAAMPAIGDAVGGTVNAVARSFAPKADKATLVAGRMLERKLGDLDAIEAATPGDIRLPFERMGKGGENLSKAVTAVPGPGQEMGEGAMIARKASAPMRLLENMRAQLGDDGSSLHNVLKAWDAKRDKEAAPFFRKAEDMGAVDSNTLRRLYGRDAVRKTLPKARAMASNQDQSGDGMLFDTVERWADEGLAPGEAPPNRDLDFTTAYNVLKKGLKVKVQRGPTLMEFISKNGGLREDGELIARDAERWHRMKPFQRKLIQEGGDSLDGWALRAQEHGFITPRQGDRATPDELMEALNDEMAGRPRYNREPQGNDLETYVSSLDERLTRAGIDPAKTDPQTAWSRLRELEGEDEVLQRMADGEDVSPGAPRIESAYTTAPTMKTHMAVKRALDDDVEEMRNPLTGKLTLTNAQRLVNDTRYAMNRELERLSPDFAEGNRLYAGPSRQMDALRRARALVNSRHDPEVIESTAKVLSEDEKGAWQIGTARAVADQLMGRNPQAFIRQLNADKVFQRRLRAGFADDAGFDDFLAKANMEADAQASMNRQLSGSRTTPLRELIDDVNSSAEDPNVLDVVANVADRRVGGESLLRQGARAATLLARRTRTPALNNPEVSRLLGEVLYEGKSPKAVIEAGLRRKAITQQQADMLLPIMSNQLTLRLSAPAE